MAEPDEGTVVRAGASEDEMCRRVIGLVFAGEESRYREFCDVLRGQLRPRRRRCSGAAP